MIGGEGGVRRKEDGEGKLMTEKAWELRGGRVEKER